DRRFWAWSSASSWRAIWASRVATRDATAAAWARAPARLGAAEAGEESPGPRTAVPARAARPQATRAFCRRDTGVEEALVNKFTTGGQASPTGLARATG